MTALIAFLKELIERLKLESPSFFKVLQNVSGILIILLGTLITLEATLNWGWESIMVIWGITLQGLCEGALALLVGVFGTAKTTVENKAKLQTKL